MSMSMVHGIVTTGWEGKVGETGEGWDAISTIQTWFQTALFSHNRYTVIRKPMMLAYQEVFEHTGEDIIAYIHDDVPIYEQDWDVRVMREFRDPQVGCVGFFGANGSCVENIYAEPCKPSNFIRRNVLCNLRRDATNHGTRYHGECDVAVFDGLALFVRREALEKIGGWPVGTAIRYWNYDLWLSCEMRRVGYRLRYVGVSCDHFSGKSLPFGAVAQKMDGSATDQTSNEAHAEAHQYLYDLYKGTGVIPYTVPR